MKLTGSGKLIFMLLAIIALSVAWGSGSGGYVARDGPFPTIQVVFKNATGPYAEAVRRTRILDTIDLDKTYYTYLLPEDLGMNAKAFLARKDLLRVVKYHILVGPVKKEPLIGGKTLNERLTQGEAVEMQTLLGPTVTVTQQGGPGRRRVLVNGTIKLYGSPGDITHDNGSLIGIETLIPFPKNMRK